MRKWSFYVVCHCIVCLPENTLSINFVKFWNSQVTGVYDNLLMYIPGMLAAYKYIRVSNLSLVLGTCPHSVTGRFGAWLLPVMTRPDSKQQP